MKETKKTPEQQITGTEENWDSRVLGADERHAKKSDITSPAELDEALNLRMISIRLEESLIEEFKALATLHGMGYQPLMRKVLKLFVEGEKKQLSIHRNGWPSNPVLSPLGMADENQAYSASYGREDVNLLGTSSEDVSEAS